MQIRIGQYDGEGGGVQEELRGNCFCHGGNGSWRDMGAVRRRRGEGDGKEMVGRSGVDSVLRSATAANPGNSDGVGPKALSVADKPPRSDNTLYNAANLNPIRVVRLESYSDKSDATDTKKLFFETITDWMGWDLNSSDERNSMRRAKINQLFMFIIASRVNGAQPMERDAMTRCQPKTKAP